MRCPPLGVSGHVPLRVISQIIQMELLTIREKVLGPKPAGLCLLQALRDVEVHLDSQSCNTYPLSGGLREKPLPAFTKPQCPHGSQKSLSRKGLHRLVSRRMEGVENQSMELATC